MTLDIERERREFEADFKEQMGEEIGNYRAAYDSCRIQDRWTGWLAAKRAVLGSAEPVAFAFVIVDKNGNPEFVTSTHDEAQAHINDAISEHNIHGAGKWRSIPAYEMRPSDDKLWDQTLRERDYNAEIADKLADAISKYFDEEIGEHSSANCPWLEALRVIEEAAPPAPVSAEPVKWEGLSEIEKSRFVDDICDYGTGFVTPLFAVIDNVEKLLKERNGSASPSTDAKDSERLDFMIKSGAYVWEVDGKWSCSAMDDHGMHDNVSGACKCASARAAIDAAITAKEAGK